MTCPYCKRHEGHYLGCQTLDRKPGLYQSWWEVAKVMVIGLGLIALLLVVVRIIGGG